MRQPFQIIYVIKNLSKTSRVYVSSDVFLCVSQYVQGFYVQVQVSGGHWVCRILIFGTVCLKEHELSLLASK